MSYSTTRQVNKLIVGACMLVGYWLSLQMLPHQLPWEDVHALQTSFANSPTHTTLPVLFKLTHCPASDQMDAMMQQYGYPHQTVQCPGDTRCKLMGKMGKTLFGLGPTVSTPYPTMVLPNGQIQRGGSAIAKTMQRQGFIPANTIIY